MGLLLGLLADSSQSLSASQPDLLKLGCSETTVVNEEPEPGSPGSVEVEDKKMPCISSTVKRDVVQGSHVISTISVRGLSLSKDTQAQLKTLIDKPLTADIVEKILFSVRDDIRKYDVIDNDSTTFSITYLLVDTKPLPSNGASPDTPRVDIAVDPYNVNVTLLRRGKTLIPYPRLITPKGSFDREGKILRAFPTLLADYSDNYGPSLALETDFTYESKSENLFEKTSERKSILPFDANLKYRKSLTKTFYDVEGNISFNLIDNRDEESLTLSADIIDSVNPLSDNRTDETAGLASLMYTKSLKGSGIVDDLSLRVRGRYADITTELRTEDISNEESGFDLFLSAQSSFPSGRLFGGAWYSYSGVNGSSDYSRVAGLASLYTDLGSSYLSPGLEVRAGAGYASTGTPAYSLYYGGIDTSSLYNSYDQLQSFTGFPAGPFLPSFGNREAVPGNSNTQGIGGNVFANLGLTFAVPIPALSKPLIPRIPTDPDFPDILVGDTMRKMFNGRGYRQYAINMLVNSGSSLESAQNEVAKVWDEVNPILDYLVDRAVLYSIRPILLSDVGYLSSYTLDSSTTWVSVGGGLQFKFVNLSAEVGYAQTVSPSAFNDTGNFFARLRIDELDFF